MSLLSGVRIIEIGTTITAPLAAMLLADFGADVVKVERPEGDPFRAFRGGSYSPQFIAYNRNKRSVVIDLSAETGRESLESLLADADVLIDNLRPSVLPRLGLAPEALRARFPRLIHCSITGFGAVGPKRDRPAFDAVAQAISGLGSLFFDPADPRVVGPTISDNVTGMYAALGILGALYERERTGTGRRLEINMLESSMAFVPDAFSLATQLNVRPTPQSRAASSQSFVFRCADGGMIAIHLSSLEKFWIAMTKAIEANELASDLRFATRMDRLTNYAELNRLLAAYFIQRPLAAWVDLLDAADVPNAAVNDIVDAMNDPQVQALSTMFTVTGTGGESLTMVHSPLHVDGARITPANPPPQLGEHTVQTLTV